MTPRPSGTDDPLFLDTSASLAAFASVRLLVPALWIAALLLGAAPHPAAAQKSPGPARVHHVAAMTAPEIAALDPARTVVLLPGGVIEEHGPYLPTFTDGYLNERLTTKLAATIAARKPGWHVLIFPTIPLGTGGANEIGGRMTFPGSYGVRFETLRAVYLDLATSLGDGGFRNIFVLQDHGSPLHNRALDEAGAYFRDAFGGRFVNLTGLEPEPPPNAPPAPASPPQRRPRTERTSTRGCRRRAGCSTSARSWCARATATPRHNRPEASKR